MNHIIKFIRQYEFLNNFYPCVVVYNGHTFNSVESAFQAQKDPMQVDRFRNMGVHEAEKTKRRPIVDPGEARRIGSKLTARSDWDSAQDRIMLELLVYKFTHNDRLKNELLDTGNAIMIHGNNWHDNYWGWCRCPECKLRDHHNKLGRMLMDLREAIREDKNPLEVIQLD